MNAGTARRFAPSSLPGSAAMTGGRPPAAHAPVARARASSLPPTGEEQKRGDR